MLLYPRLLLFRIQQEYKKAVEAVEGVEVEAGGGDLAAGAGGGDAQAAEFGPGFDGGGEDAVPVSGG